MKQNSVLHKISLFIASGLGSGFSPKAPGTVGTLACLLLWYLASASGILVGFASQATLLAMVILLGFVTTRICLLFVSDRAPEGKDHLDPQFIVIDEWAGLLFALLGLSHTQTIYILLGFALFRLFDIIKPGPVGWLERLPGEWGIMMDDVCAGLIAYGILLGIQLCFS